MSASMLHALYVVFAVAAITTATENDTRDSTAIQPHNPRVLFITTKNCPRCEQELARLNRAGGDFEKMRSRGWKIGEGADNHLQIVDRDAAPDCVRKIEVREFPAVACIEKDEVVRSFQSGCTTPLDMWTFAWLAKGIDERPPAVVPEAARVESTGSYRLRGNHWSVDGDWNPTRATVISHLRSPAHVSHLLATWQIDNWSYEELRALHDDLHERELANGGGYASRGANRGNDQFGAGRKIAGAYGH
jgi:hypothetical protein